MRRSPRCSCTASSSRCSERGRTSRLKRPRRIANREPPRLTPLFEFPLTSGAADAWLGMLRGGLSCLRLGLAEPSYNRRSNAPYFWSLPGMGDTAFFLISSCTRRAHATIQPFERLKFSLQSIMGQFGLAPAIEVRLEPIKERSSPLLNGMFKSRNCHRFNCKRLGLCVPCEIRPTDCEGKQLGGRGVLSTLLTSLAFFPRDAHNLRSQPRAWPSG